MNKRKPVVMISFDELGMNGGPYISHQRIMNGRLREDFDFVPLIINRHGSKLKKILNIVKQIKAVRPDILHCHGLQLSGFYCVLAARICRVKSVLAIRGSSLEAIDIPRYVRIIMNRLEILTLQMSSATYGVSDYVSNWPRVRKYCKNKCYGTIYNVPHTSFSDDAFNRSDDGRKYTTILYAGRIVTDKGLDTILKIIQRISPEEMIRFLIVGDGNYLETLRNQVKNSRMKDNVIFFGYQKDVIPYYKQSDIFLTCTKHETLCNSLIEAGGEGLPLVASNVGGIPEIITESVNGYLVAVDDVDGFVEKIRLLAEDKKLREEMGRESKIQISKKFNEEESMTNIKCIYISLMEGKGKRACHD